jgi:DNA-binding response OmpR family regulator
MSNRGMIGTASVPDILPQITDSELQAIPIARVLLVEDNNTSQQLMSDYLEYHGYQVLSLSQGSLVAAAIEQFQPHIILLDLKLPDVDGFTLLHQFQQDCRRPSVPIIVVSAFAFQADQQRAFSLGARRYFVKPVNLGRLKRAICEELNAIIS